MSETEEKAIQFLHEKGALDKDCIAWEVNFEDGRLFDIVKLMEEFGIQCASDAYQYVESQRVQNED